MSVGEGFAFVLYRRMVMRGLMRMRRINSLTVPSGDFVQLKPGGLHLMMMGPRRHLMLGETIEVDLHFEGGSTQRLVLKVEDR